jgi:hypothetical protein
MLPVTGLRSRADFAPRGTGLSDGSVRAVTAFLFT